MICPPKVQLQEIMRERERERENVRENIKIIENNMSRKRVKIKDMIINTKLSKPYYVIE